MEQFEKSGATVTRQAIALRAYQIYEQTGQPKGRELDHWLKAEAELASAGNRASAAANGSAQPVAPVRTQQPPKPEKTVVPGSLPIGVKRTTPQSGR